MLDERLLRILVCPGCRAGLEYKERRKVLICTGCGHRYEVRDGIPILLPPAGDGPVADGATDADAAGDAGDADADGARGDTDGASA